MNFDHDSAKRCGWKHVTRVPQEFVEGGDIGPGPVANTHSTYFDVGCSDLALAPVWMEGFCRAYSAAKRRVPRPDGEATGGGSARTGVFTALKRAGEARQNDYVVMPAGDIPANKVFLRRA